MQIFVVVAQEQGFSAASRRLGLSAASVTRAVAALEQHIGTQLLVRTTRTVHLTEAGQRYCDDCRRILAEVQEAEDSAAGSHALPRGQLTITAPVLFGDLFVTPVMADYLCRYPDVSINALLLDRVVNMVEEGIDVAVRIGELPDSNQHAIRVGVMLEHPPIVSFLLGRGLVRGLWGGSVRGDPHQPRPVQTPSDPPAANCAQSHPQST